MLKNPNNCHYKSSLDVAATNQSILADGLISFKAAWTVSC